MSVSYAHLFLIYINFVVAKAILCCQATFKLKKREDTGSLKLGI